MHGNDKSSGFVGSRVMVERAEGLGRGVQATAVAGLKEMC